MCKEVKNYMDNFKNPKEFILNEICKNKGTQNNIMKADLIAYAKKMDIEFDEKKTDKLEISKLIIEKVDIEKFAEYCHVGVNSYAFQLKFNITNEDVKLMAKKGLIKITGKERFRGYSGYSYANVYSVFDYYRLTIDDVCKWLEKNKKSERKK